MTAVVGLRWSADLDRAVVGDVTGHAELAVNGTDAASAIALVDAVLVDAVLVADGRRCASPGTAPRLAVADRDRILVQIHLGLYGPLIESTLTCRACGEKFNLGFRLDELAAHCEPAASGDVASAPEAEWRVGDVAYRPLTGADELAVLGTPDPAGGLLRRVTGGDVPGGDVRTSVGNALAQRTPSVSAPVGASCPECGDRQAVEFDVQYFLLARIVGERPRLWQAVHLIASAYRWPRGDILALARGERESYVEAITSNALRRRRGR